MLAKVIDNFIKNNISDVCFYVMNAKETEDALIMTGLWYTLGQTHSSLIASDKFDEHTIKVLKKDLDKWKYCVTPYEKCLRLAEWGTL